MSTNSVVKKTWRVSQKLGGAFKARYALMMLKERYLASEFPPVSDQPPPSRLFFSRVPLVGAFQTFFCLV